MDHYKTESYISNLEKIVSGYNNLIHSSMGYSPNIAWSEKSTHVHIRDKLQKYYDKVKKKNPSFKVGDIVRIKSLSSSAFTKGYEIKNNTELYIIKTVISYLPIPMYTLKSLEKSDEGIIKGRFYEHELSKVNKI